jgi:hypothetical protein
VDLPGVDIDDSERRQRDERAQHEYEERAHGLPPEIAAEIAVRIAKEQGPSSAR